MKKILIGILTLLMISCKEKPEETFSLTGTTNGFENGISSKLNNSDKMVISGKLFSSKSKMIYLNKIDHFDYLNDEYTIDSTSVSENGEFKFNAKI